MPCLGWDNQSKNMVQQLIFLRGILWSKLKVKVKCKKAVRNGHMGWG